MTSFDIFNPMVSKVAKGLEGKTILIAGSNNLGKTKQATRMEKPFYLGFEKGIRAISGVPFLPINTWGDFLKINRQLTNPKNLEKAREMYSTIIFDEVYTSALYCQDYLCKLHGVNSIGEGNNGYGLWKEYEKEYWTQLDKLINSGFTIVFISHVEETEVVVNGQKIKKMIPKGDKRSITPVIDNCDIVAYLTSNGVDENGNVVPSSAWFAETPHWFARSKFDYMTTHIQEFSAENLEKAVHDAIAKQEEAEGVQAVSYEEQVESYKSEKIDFAQVMNGIKEVGNKLFQAGLEDATTEVVEKRLGKGKLPAELKESQSEVAELLLIDLQDLADEKLSN